MSEYNDTQVRRLDFMLLLVLREGVRRRKLSDVAATLGVTQTAISHSVTRLRDLFDDELFIRRPHGVEPTARAIELARIAESVIETAGRMLTAPTPFDPLTEDRDLRICALDFEMVLLSGLVDRLQQEAPGIRLQFHSMGRDAAISALERDEVDLWLGFARDLPATLDSAKLFDETYRVIARNKHPKIAANDPPDLDTYCSQRHVLVSPGGTRGGIVDDALKAQGRARNMAVTTSGFLSALDLVARTDLIATVPASLATAQAQNFDLLVAEPPVALRQFPVAVAWHRRASGQQAIAWFIGLVREELGEPGLSKEP